MPGCEMCSEQRGRTWAGLVVVSFAPCAVPCVEYELQRRQDRSHSPSVQGEDFFLQPRFPGEHDVDVVAAESVRLSRVLIGPLGTAG